MMKIHSRSALVLHTGQHASKLRFTWVQVTNGAAHLAGAAAQILQVLFHYILYRRRYVCPQTMKYTRWQF